MKRTSEQDLSPGSNQAKIRPQQFAQGLLITQNAHRHFWKNMLQKSEEKPLQS